MMALATAVVAVLMCQASFRLAVLLLLLLGCSKPNETSETRPNVKHVHQSIEIWRLANVAYSAGLFHFE